jgi:hypothetical protein
MGPTSCSRGRVVSSLPERGSFLRGAARKFPYKLTFKRIKIIFIDSPTEFRIDEYILNIFYFIINI